VATIKFYTVDSDKQLNTTKRTHYCVAMAVLAIFIILQRVTYGSTIQIKLIAAFPLQKRLCQHAKVLHVVYNAYLVISCAHVITGIVRISRPIASVQTETLHINSDGF